MHFGFSEGSSGIRVPILDNIKLTSDISVTLVDHVGDDSKIVSAAKVRLLGEKMDEGWEKLIPYMMKHRHGSPFEHGSMTFQVHAPIFVFREWHRHRIGWSYNETSARYRELEPVFWIPRMEREMVPAAGSTSARPSFQRADGPLANDVRVLLAASYKQAYAHYRYLLDRKVAKEVVRSCLPVAIYSSMYATCNPRSLMHFLSLRTRSTLAKYPSYPQAEIEEAAVQMEETFGKLYPVTWAAFNNCGRVAP